MLSPLLRRLALGAILVLSWFATPSAMAQEESQKASESIVIEGYAFPQSIAGLSRGPNTTYSEKGYGFSVRYSSGRNRWADIYVYDKQLNLAPPPGDALKREMIRVLQEILVAQKLGSYESAKIESATLQKTLASARLRVIADGHEQMTFAYLTIAHGKFLKIRYSTTFAKTGQEQAESFRNAAFGLLRKSRPVVQPRRDPRFL